MSERKKRARGLSARAILRLAEKIAGKAYRAGRCDRKPGDCMHAHHDSRDDWKDLGRRIRKVTHA